MTDNDPPSFTTSMIFPPATTLEQRVNHFQFDREYAPGERIVGSDGITYERVHRSSGTGPPITGFSFDTIIVDDPMLRDPEISAAVGRAMDRFRRGLDSASTVGTPPDTPSVVTVDSIRASMESVWEEFAEDDRNRQRIERELSVGFHFDFHRRIDPIDALAQSFDLGLSEAIQRVLRGPAPGSSERPGHCFRNDGVERDYSNRIGRTVNRNGTEYPIPEFVALGDEEAFITRAFDAREAMVEQHIESVDPSEIGENMMNGEYCPDCVRDLCECDEENDT